MINVDCKEFREKLFLYPEVDDDFYNHLKTCSYCREEFYNLLRIEEKMKIPILQEEIDFEWERIQKNIYRKITFEKLKYIIFISILTFLGSFLSYIFFIFIYFKLNLYLIFHGISIILKEISYSFLPIVITCIVLIAVKNELSTNIYKNEHK
jgi:hypothetical protein